MNKALLSCALSLVTACGSAKALKNAERDRDAKAREITRLEDRNTELRDELQGIQVTDNHLWVSPKGSNFLISYEEAKSLCEDIGYNLPDQAAVAEFMAQQPAYLEALHNFRINAGLPTDQIHLRGEISEPSHRWVICELARRK